MNLLSLYKVLFTVAIIAAYCLPLTSGEMEEKFDRLNRGIEELDHRGSPEGESYGTYDPSYRRSMETESLSEEIERNEEQLDEAFPESPYGHEYNRP